MVPQYPRKAVIRPVPGVGRWHAVCVLGLICACWHGNAQEFSVLVFSGTEEYRHASIEAGVQALQSLGDKRDFHVVATEDPTHFDADSLRRYAAVVFLNTSGDVLDSAQQHALEAYVTGGGGFVGIHGAAATEYHWPFYESLVGAFFEDHPRVQPARVLVTDRKHPATSGLPFRWDRVDEWYNYRMNPRKDVHVLAAVAEASYEGGAMGHDHPIVWAHTNLGGRAFYTGLGHTTESYADPLMLEHLRGGIEWAAGRWDADVMATRAAGFEEVVLTGQLTDPMEIAIANDGRVFIIEWAGSVKVWEPETEAVRVVGWIPVEKHIEDGLLGLALDPDFEKNGWLYLYYSAVTVGDKFNRLSRFEYDGHSIDMESEVVMLEIPVQRVQCCHSAGSIQFDKDGLLYLSTGDNSGGPRDHEDEDVRRMADHGRTSANTNDLRGKILRIRPEADGTYSIPTGNLFAADSLHRGEIYTMGHRNPFRIAIDDATGWVYWGDVGPGNGNGMDEFNQARGPGFFGWPLFTGYNVPYDLYHVHGADDMSPFVDPAAPINASPYNTGVRNLPPAQGAWIPYIYGTSAEFPSLGAGGINPMAGPIFHYDHDAANAWALPSYYDDKVMIYEWMRDWVMVVTVDEEGDIVKLDPFLPGFDYIAPMDIEVGPHGRLYILEWGGEFWGSNPDAQLVRLDYYGDDSRRPVSVALKDEAASALEIVWPPDGGVFDFEAGIRYEVLAYDKALSEMVELHTYSGFDTSPIPLATYGGPIGTVTIPRTYTHEPDVHYVDRFAELRACLPGARCDHVKLQPRTKEAEHVTDSRLARRETYSARPASEHWGRTVLSAMQLQDSSQLAYAPVNLAGIASITMRFRVHSSGEAVMRVGEDVTQSVLFGPETGEAVRPHQADYAAGVPADASGMGLLPKDAYDDWREVTVEVAGADRSLRLVLEFYSVFEGIFLELDWLRFNGPGITEP